MSQISIKSIRVANVRGISEREFQFTIPPMIENKFHILVAPNGFGKSSLATAFKSLKPRSLKLEKQDYHRGDESLNPALEIVVNEGGIERSLIANSSLNDLHKEFSVCVINCKLKAKAISRPYIARARPTAEMAVEPTTLVEKIPSKPSDIPKQAALKGLFGNNGKVLPPLSKYLTNPQLLASICGAEMLNKFTQKSVWKKIDPILEAVNAHEGNVGEIKTWFKQEHLADIECIEPIMALASLFNNFDSLDEADRVLAGIALGMLHRSNSSILHELKSWLQYRDAKDRCDELLADLNSNPDWLDVRAREDHGKLVVKFPKASDMSNGQRDLFSFVSQLLKAEFELTANKSILIVDEVFDYLDESNLLAAQYYISEFIKAFKKSGRKIFPLFLTHLDPSIFGHSVLGLGRSDSRKVHVLDQSLDISRQSGLPLMVRKREDAVLKPFIGKYLFHYHPDCCDEGELFTNHGLKKIYGQSSEFYTLIFEELEKYQNDENEIDYVAVCVGARVAIEKHAYDQLNEDEQKRRFTEEFNKKTSEKLDFAESVGVKVPSAHRLLGLLYNDMLHAKEHFDYISSIVSKMKNPAIRGLMKKIPIPQTSRN